MKYRGLFFTGAITLSALALPGAISVQAADYYAGKTITILVGFPGGSPATAIARMVARQLPNHVPGKPTLRQARLRR